MHRQDRDAGHDEQKQRDYLHQHVGKHGGAGEAGRDAEEGHDAGAGDLAADLRHRQQHVDRLADQPHPDAGGERCLCRRRKDEPPAEPGADKRHRAQRDNRYNAEAHCRKSLRDGAKALLGDDRDRQDEAKPGRDDEQTFHAATVH